LNLANTYYLLNNFKNADYYYSKVESLSPKILSNIQFQTNEMKQVYYYQFARSALLSGNSKKANALFSKLLFELEHLFSINYKLKNHTDVIEKLSLVHSMSGITSMEQGNWQSCIKSFESALSYTKLSKMIPQSMIHISMGICYQKQGKWLKSEEQVSQSLKLSDYPDLVDDDSAIWNYLLPDSVRIIGDSRYPGAFKSKDIYLLSTGVSLNNKIEESEFGNALKLIDSRIKYVNEN
jgi:tetratricopeptide (TPR) repeat protein